MKFKTTRSAAAGLGVVLGAAMGATIASPPTTIPVSDFEIQQHTVGPDGHLMPQFGERDTAPKLEELKKERPHETMRFIVALNELPSSLYTGGIDGFEPTSPMVTGQDRLQTGVDAVQAYESFLRSQQQGFLQEAASVLNRKLDPVHNFVRTINGLVVEATPSEAARLNNVPGVRYVTPDRELTIDTDTGPGRIGAPDVWDNDDPMVANRGEGVVVGVVDTGIIADHVAFASEVEANEDFGIEAYTHTNPLGEGVYLGVCDQEHDDYDPDFPCNAKLIGAYDYSGTSADDDNGHGSHVAGTAAGNPVVMNLFPWYDPEEMLVAAEDEDAPFEAFVSGVAQRANVISYRVCAPGCPVSDSVAAFEQAIEDGVDVLNFSVSGANDPYGNDPVSEAWLSATHAGMFVAASAGNDGPGAGTVSKLAPWVSSVGSNTHGRTIRGVADLTVEGGEMEIGPFQGGGLTGSYTGEVVLGEDFGTQDQVARQCADTDAGFFGPVLVNPFGPGEFDGEIVVCELAVDDILGIVLLPFAIQNVAASGGGGVIVHNAEDLFFVDAEGNETFSAGFRGDAPAVSVTYETGAAIREWLESGEDHLASISAAAVEFIHDEAAAGQMSSFSSRGPSSFAPEYADLLKPDITAPGQNIMAPYWADIGAANAENYHAISGTSMSSPHVAGAAALVRGAHSSWTPMQVKSALMLTAEALPGFTWYDQGAGEARVAAAVEAGLVMDESIGNMIGADPFAFGNLRTLNLASMANRSCLASCSWERTVTATSGGSFTFEGQTIQGDVDVSVSPSSVTLEAGQSAIVKVTMSGPGLIPVADGSTPTAFGRVLITDESGGPDMAMPIAAEPDDSLTRAEVQFGSGLDDLYGLAHTLSEGTVWAGSRELVGGDDQLHEYTFAGQPTGNALSTKDYADADDEEWGAGVAWNRDTGTLWQVNIGGDGCIHEVDPEEGATGVSICPEEMAASGDNGDDPDPAPRAVAYDAVNQLLFVGEDQGNIHVVDLDGQILQTVATGYAITGLAYNPANGMLFVADVADASADIFVHDVNAGFAFVTDYAIADDQGNRVFEGGYLADVTFDCDGVFWMAHSGNQAIYGIDLPAAGNACPGSMIDLSGQEATGSEGDTADLGYFIVDGVIDGTVIDITYTTTGADWLDEFVMDITSPAGTTVRVAGGDSPFGGPADDIDYLLDWPASSGTESAILDIDDFDGEDAGGLWVVNMFSTWGASDVAGFMESGSGVEFGGVEEVAEFISFDPDLGVPRGHFDATVNTKGSAGEFFMRWGHSEEMNNATAPMQLTDSVYPQSLTADIGPIRCSATVYAQGVMVVGGEEIETEVVSADTADCPVGEPATDTSSGTDVGACSMGDGRQAFDPMLPMLAFLALFGLVVVRRRV